jgi:phosphoribosylformylglycinamidine synthase
MGICNGFQALVKSGILPGANVVSRRVVRAEQSDCSSSLVEAFPTQQFPSKQDASENREFASGYGARNDIAVTLTFNAQGHFECRWVILKPLSQNCIWTRELDELIECPVAHGEGNFQTSELFPLDSLIENDQIALAYVCPDGTSANGEYPINPNGSVLDIAGICNPQGNVLGLMPHPENHIHPYQHPQWTRTVNQHSGLKLFENGVKYANDL